MGSDEDMVGASASVPERVIGGDEFHGGADEGAGVADRREAIDGAEVAGDVDRDEEEVSVVRVKGANLTGQQGSVNGNF